MAAVLHHKVVSALPATLAADSIYFVRVGTGFDIYVTNSSGTIAAYPINGKISYFNASGAINAPVKKWIATVTPTTANANAIDISSAGFTTILGVQVIAIKNSSTALDCPQVSVKSITPTSLVVNITNGNSSVVGVLGATVNGVIFPASVAGITLSVEVTGY